MSSPRIWKAFLQQQGATPTAQSGRRTRTRCVVRRRGKHCRSLLLFRLLTLSFELTPYMRRTIVIPTAYLQPPSHKDNDSTSTRFVTVSLSAVCNTTFSLTLCLLIVSLGILARVGQEHRSGVWEQLLSKTRIALKSIKRRC